MAQPLPDFDEIVMLPGRGQMTLRSAIRRVMGEPSPPGMIRQTSVFRDADKEPTIYDFADIERLATALDEVEQREQRASLIFARHAEGLSLEEIGREVDLSRERVRQIINEATRKATRNARILTKWAGVFINESRNAGR